MKREHFLTHSMRSAGPEPKPNRDTTGRESHTPISPMDAEARVLNKTLAKGIH